MSEIEKMYENAGIEPTYTDECIIADRYWENEELANEYGTFDKFMEENCKFGYQDCTDECEYAYDKVIYPSFTAEKQIELIKWLKDNRDFHTYGKWCTSCDSTGEVIEHRSELFEEALAGLINQLWKADDLTEEEKQQVKGILEVE